MHFQHSVEIWRDYPELVPGVLFASGVHGDVTVDRQVAELNRVARDRLGDGSASALPEIQAWRRAFARMGLKPTQYRNASESLLRRFAKEGGLPQIHPLIDLCNAVSLAFAIPVAVFDVARIEQWVDVRHASGTETYVTFAGETEHPDRNEVVFVDAADMVHARRWTNRQSGLSAVQSTTSRVLIVAEAMHHTGATDIERLVDVLAHDLEALWSITPTNAVLTPTAPRFEF